MMETKGKIYTKQNHFILVSIPECTSCMYVCKYGMYIKTITNIGDTYIVSFLFCIRYGNHTDDIVLDHLP